MPAAVSDWLVVSTDWISMVIGCFPLYVRPVEKAENEGLLKCDTLGLFDPSDLLGGEVFRRIAGETELDSLIVCRSRTSMPQCSLQLQLIVPIVRTDSENETHRQNMLPPV